MTARTIFSRTMFRLIWLSTRVFHDDICRLLRNHVDWHDYEKSGDSGKNRRVNDAQTFYSANSKPRVQHGILVICSPDLASARSVVTPRTVLDEPADTLIRFQVDALHDFRMEFQFMLRAF